MSESPPTRERGRHRDLANRQRVGAGPAPSYAYNQKTCLKFPAICKPCLPKSHVWKQNRVAAQERVVLSLA
jgi:hypothetical protein